MRSNVRPTALFLISLLPMATVVADEVSLEQFDLQLMAELEEINWVAAETFRQANEAREAGDHKRASRLYGEVAELVPGFSHARRRQAHEELNLGNRDLGIELMRQAIGVERSALNLSGLAAALLWPAETSEPSGPEIAESLLLANEAANLDSEDMWVQFTLCQSALANEDLVALEKSLENLRKHSPENLETHYCAFFTHAYRGRFDEAELSLERARSAGLQEETFEALSASLQDARPITDRFLSMGAWVGGIWATSFLTLLFLGWVMSRVALREADRASTAATTGEAAGFSLLLRRLYGVVLWLSCAFYYVSIPLILVSVIALGGGLLYMFLVVGHIPIKLVLVIIVVMAVTLWAIVKSLLTRMHDGEPGLRLVPGAHPKLKSVLEEVAAKIGTKPVDSVYMTPGTDLAVMERGRSMLRRYRSERCLILGVGVLEGMQVDSLKAILAHEYGHFSNRDTAGGTFSIRVRLSLLAMARSLAEGGAAAWYNPAWLFLQAFYRVFLVISQGATRLQEVLADRWAASMYGAQQFENGLRHVITQEVAFSDHINRTLEEAINENRPLANLYRYKPKNLLQERHLADRVEAVINAPASLYDSHPSPADRFKWVHKLPERTNGEHATSSLRAWDLLKDRADLELAMTEVIRENVYESSGYRIAATAEEARGSIWD